MIKRCSYCGWTTSSGSLMHPCSYSHKQSIQSAEGPRDQFARTDYSSTSVVKRTRLAEHYSEPITSYRSREVFQNVEDLALPGPSFSSFNDREISSMAHSSAQEIISFFPLSPSWHMRKRNPRDYDAPSASKRIRLRRNSLEEAEEEMAPVPVSKVTPTDSPSELEDILLLLGDGLLRLSSEMRSMFVSETFMKLQNLIIQKEQSQRDRNEES